MISKKFLQYIKWIWILAVIIALTYYLITNWEKMIHFFSMIPKQNLFYSVLFIILGKLCLFLLAKFSVDREGFHLTFQQIFIIVSTTQLGKYIPGGVWHFVGRYNAYQNEEISLKKSTKALISENLWLLSGALIIGVLFGLQSTIGKKLLEEIGLSILPPYVLLYSILIFIFWILFLIAYDAISQKRFPPKDVMLIIRLIAVQTLTWVFLGISFLFLFPNASLNLAPDAIFGFTISWAIGYVAVFAPGGIGIREGALVWIFSSLFLADDILVYSTVHRFLYVAVEFILGIGSLLLQPILIAKQNNTVSSDQKP